MAHFAWSIAVKRLASRIDIFTNEDICFAIAELTSVKDADFHHISHLLSRKYKKPASEETGQ
jgi:UDP-3-O-[3-hydroxymyristoyl] glucosamine N-acyltransferase